MKSDASSYYALIEIVNKRLAGYLESSQKGEGDTLNQISADQLAGKLDIKRWIEDGGMDVENVNEFLDPYLMHSQRMHHPHYIGHQVSVPHLASGAADLVHGSINNPMAIYEMGPSAAVIEKTMVNWLLSKIGWLSTKDITSFGDVPGNGSGVFTHGGSIANLTALLAARAAIAPEAWEEGTPNDLVVIGSEVAHYSIARSISIIGMGKKSLMTVEVDDEERMKPDALEKVVQRAIKQGKRIMAVIANACATSTGLYDPLEAIGSICQRYKIWFHVDGAHGASALLSKKYEAYMEGVSLADSLIWDTHKMLRTSTLAAAVLFKDPKKMMAAFQQKGSYLFHEKENLGFDLMPYTIECTKAALATKLFWVLAAEGEEGLSNFIDQQFQKTLDFYHWISEQVDFECPYVPESNILCFRYNKGRLSNDFQLKLRNQLTLEGKFYISSTEINQIRYLRLTVMNPLTELDHIQKLIQEIRSLAVRMRH